MIKIAVLDLYDGYKNIGLPSIVNIANGFSNVQVDVFDVRKKCELPGLNYDLYLSSGGPGSPLEGDGIWDRAYFYLIDKLWEHNQFSEDKKYVFFVCHSFQMMCRHLSIASVVRRKSESLGVYPVHKTEDGLNEDLLMPLTDPFFVADSREWQVIQPNFERMAYLGCKILGMEKERPHVPLEQAVMMIRFSNEMIGTQFHPEANSSGMEKRFSDVENIAKIVTEHGQDRMDKILSNLTEHRQQLDLSHSQILPQFIRNSIRAIEENSLLLV